MAVLGRLLKFWSRTRSEIGPDLVDAVGTPGSDDAVPTEQAVREALSALAPDHGDLAGRDEADQHPETAISFSDVTDGNASTEHHGYMPKLSGEGSQYIGGDGEEHALPEPDLSACAKLGDSNEFSEAQTVGTSYLSADAFGEIAWDTDGKQNCELTVDCDITGWTIQSGAAGRFLFLRLYRSGSYSIAWPSDTFKGMSDFTLPESGQVTFVAFRMKTDSVLEFQGQGPTFAEWDL